MFSCIDLSKSRWRCKLNYLKWIAFNFFSHSLADILNPSKPLFRTILEKILNLFYNFDNDIIELIFILLVGISDSDVFWDFKLSIITFLSTFATSISQYFQSFSCIYIILLS